MLRRNKPLQRKKALGPGKKALGRSGWTKAAPSSKPNRTPEDESDGRRLRAHAALWVYLKDRETFAFQEHHRIGARIADFYCPAARLAIFLTDQTEDDSAVIGPDGGRQFAFSAQKVLADPQAVAAIIAESFTLRLIPR